MDTDFRYKVRHVGDFFISTICDVVNSAKGCAKGIILTYDINELRRKKKTLTKKIGRRLIELKEEDPDLHVSDDEKLEKLFSEMDEVRQKIDACVKERGV